MRPVSTVVASRQHPKMTFARMAGMLAVGAIAVVSAFSSADTGPAHLPLTGPVLLAPDAPAAAVPSLPAVGMQDGWVLDRPSPHGCANGASPNYATGTIPAAMDDSNFDDLHVHQLRVSVPWDIADPSQNPDSTVQAQLNIMRDCLSYWLALIWHHNSVDPGHWVNPEVQFKPDDSFLNTSTDPNKHMPTLFKYRAAVRKFLKTYACVDRTGKPARHCAIPDPDGFPYAPISGNPSPPMIRVDVVAPWGEPDFQDPGHLYHMPSGSHLFSDSTCPSFSPNNCGPVLAARMWVFIQGLCKGCTVIAGTFSGAAGLEHNGGGPLSYLDIYASHLDNHPVKVWSFDDYPDTSTFQRNCAYTPAYSVVSAYGPLPPPPSSVNCAPAFARINTAYKRASMVYRFSRALKGFGYGPRTHIWFGEISVYNLDEEHCSSGNCPYYGEASEADGMNFLINHLAKPANFTPKNGSGKPDAPVVTRLYYMRYSDGADFADWALILANPNPCAGPVNGVACGTVAQVPAYTALKGLWPAHYK